MMLILCFILDDTVKLIWWAPQSDISIVAYTEILKHNTLYIDIYFDMNL